MERLEQIAVVGLSLAGLRAIEALRKRGFGGRIVAIGAEPRLPYDRPPLSKELLRGEWEAERTALRKLESWHELALDLRLGRRAVALDVAGRSLELDSGEHVRWDGLIVASGASPRWLPGLPRLAGVQTLRTLDDALALRGALEQRPRVVVVGAGFIGSEVAASCRARGLDVVLLEALATPLARALGHEMGELCAALHRDHGVDLRCGVGVDGVEGERRVERVRLSDGSSVDADLVVIGVGVVPETGWLASSGLRLDDGLVCDATCAAAPGIVAAGDVARWYNPLFDESMRVEHWMNASEQGTAAARRLLDGPAAEPFANVPFFWSDQYDVKIQSAGRLAGSDEVRIVDGDPSARRFVALYGRKGRLVGVLAFNRPRPLVRYRRLIAERLSIDEAIARASAP